MKKITILLTVFVVFVIAACGNNGESGGKTAAAVAIEKTTEDETKAAAVTEAVSTEAEIGTTDSVETEAPSEEETTEKDWQAVHSVSGFDEMTNIPTEYEGFLFQRPCYYDQEFSSAGFDLSFCPEVKEHYASIVFGKYSETLTKEQYEAGKELLAESLGSLFEGNDEADRKEFQKKDFYGIESYFLRYAFEDAEAVVFLTFNPDSGKMIYSICTYDSIDESDHDYIGDFYKMIETAEKIEKGVTEETAKEDEKIEESASGIRPEFKAAMDSYEEFFSEYIVFMEKYAASSNPLGMMSDYLNYLNTYTEVMEQLEKIESEEMTVEEEKYYLDVMNRINKKLLDVSY